MKRRDFTLKKRGEGNKSPALFYGILRNIVPKESADEIYGRLFKVKPKGQIEKEKSND